METAVVKAQVVNKEVGPLAPMAEAVREYIR